MGKIKISKPKEEMVLVRIDAKTYIEVPANKAKDIPRLRREYAERMSITGVKNRYIK